MFDAIIPLRSKSQGLKNKNISPFYKKINLANFTINKLINIKKIRKIYILSDSIKYKKKITSHKKVDKSYLRKIILSESNSKIDSLIDDFLKNYYLDNEKQNFLLFQVTNPTLSVKEIRNTINFIQKKKISSLMHVTKVLESPYEMIEKKKKKWNFLMKKRFVNRQSYKKTFYFITGSLFFFTRNFFQKYKQIYNKKTFAYEVDKINFVDIDDKFTFELAKKVINSKIRN